MNLKLHSLMQHSHIDCREARDDDREGSCAYFKFTVSEVEVTSCSVADKNKNKKKHFNQKQLMGVRDLFGLYYWVRVYY